MTFVADVEADDDKQPATARVTGGTGLIGRIVVGLARDAGWEPVVLARSAGVDLLTGSGLDAALDGVETVVDLTNVQTTKRSAAIDFFGTTSSILLRAGKRAGVQHHLVLSIVGVDRVDTGYYAGKRHQEDVVTSGPVPWTILRSTQFHEFAEQVRTLVPGPVALLPKMLTQPVAAREVARHLIDLAGGPASGRAAEIAGPEVHRMAELVRRLARADGSRRPVLELPAVGSLARAAATGGLLPAAPGPRGTQTFDQWRPAPGCTTHRRVQRSRPRPVITRCGARTGSRSRARSS